MTKLTSEEIGCKPSIADNFEIYIKNIMSIDISSLYNPNLKSYQHGDLDALYNAYCAGRIDSILDSVAEEYHD